MAARERTENNAAQPPSSGPVSAFVTPIDGLIRNRNLSAPTAPGQLATLDRFEILRLIGAGGMGVVFLARDPGNDAKVAIKMLRPELAVEPQAVRRFLKEVRHLRRLQHPHILGILEMSERKEGPYFVMPYLERGSLARIIRPGEPLALETASTDHRTADAPRPQHSPKATGSRKEQRSKPARAADAERPRTDSAVLSIARQIADALAYAHSKGIIHRDLKPGNILLDAEGSAFLTDFGLARTLFNDSMMDVDRGHCEGTAPYMSPAVAAGQAEDTRCDIYSFGALLYEMLTGGAPYGGETTAEVLKQVQAGPPKRISDVCPEASPELAGIAEGAMARSHRDRYAGMADVVADLERVEKQQPPLGPHGQWRAPRRWPSLIRRRPMAALGGLAVATLVGLGVVWLLPSLKTIHHFPLPEGASWGSAQVGDWDGDKEPELFVMHSNKCAVLSADGSLVTDFGLAEPVDRNFGLSLVTDVNGDGLDDVFLHWYRSGQAHTAAFNRNEFELMRFSVDGEGAVHPQRRRADTELVPRLISDFDHNGRSQLLAVAATGWAAPRRLCCFDVANRSLAWSHPIAPYPTSLVVGDLDGDGSEEIVLGSDAVANDISLADGTDDSHCYLYAFGSRGALLWRLKMASRELLIQGARLGSVSPSKTELGNAYLKCYPLLSGTNRQSTRLYAWVQGHYEHRGAVGESELGLVEAIDPKGNITSKYDAGACLLSCVTDDVDGNGEPEILATDRLGYLHMLDPNLKLRQKVQISRSKFDWVSLELITVTNLISKTGKDLVFSSSQVEFVAGRGVGNDLTKVMVRFFHHNSLEVWDSSLRRVATYTFENRLKQQPGRTFRVADWDGDGVQEIVVLGRTVRVLKFARRGL